MYGVVDLIYVFLFKIYGVPSLISIKALLAILKCISKKFIEVHEGLRKRLLVIFYYKQKVHGMFFFYYYFQK